MSSNMELSYRDQLKTFVNKTTNRIWCFFLMEKTALRCSARSIAKRFHVTECMEIVLTVLDHKPQLSGMEDYHASQ